MTAFKPRRTGGVLLMLLAASLTASATAGPNEFTLTRAVPDDVFLCITGRHNPERQFLDEYWGEVFEAFTHSGVGEDFMALLATLIGGDQMTEVQRVKGRALELIAGVNWEQLGAGELVFAERFASPVETRGGGISVGPPDLVWMSRSSQGTAENYQGLVAILEALVEEINKAADGAVPAVERGQRHGTDLASARLVKVNDVYFTLTVGQREDVVLITFGLGDRMLNEVLGLLAGEGTANAIRDNPRYAAALAKLPPAEDGFTFFDMQAMLRPIRTLLDNVIEREKRGGPNDVVLNSKKEGPAFKLCMQAWKVYEQKDYAKGLELVEQAYEIAPSDSRVLYYLACFHALNGNDEQALRFLGQSVEGGFYCPKHITWDPDLETIREDARYTAALALAREKAAQFGSQKAASEAAVVHHLVTRLMDAVILDYIAASESTDGYSTRIESLAVLVPDAKSRPIYPVFAGRPPLTQFDRYLPQETLSFSVSNGLDFGALYDFLEETVQQAGPKGEELLAMWAGVQASIGLDVKKDVLSWIEGGLITVTLDDGQGSVWLIKVTDEQVAREKVTAALDFLSTQLAELATQNPMLAMMAVTRSPTQHDQLEGFENLHFAMSPRPIVWGTADQYLIFATSADAVALCLNTAKGTHPNIRENARAMQEAVVPTGPFSSVTLTDQRKFGQELAAGIGMVSMMSGMMGAFIPDPDARPIIQKIAGMLAKLTPVVSKIDFYKSTATQTTFDGQAWHTQTVTHYVSPEERRPKTTQPTPTQ